MSGWYLLPPGVRRVHLAWWAAFFGGLLGGLGFTQSFLIAAYTGFVGVPVFLALDDDRWIIDKATRTTKGDA